MMQKHLAALLLTALALPPSRAVADVFPAPSGGSGSGMQTTAGNAQLPASATNLSKWTTQVHQNTQSGECYGTGSGRVVCASDQNHDLIADHSTIQTQDASLISYMTVGGTVTPGDVVGLTWTVASVVYNIRYTVQAGDTTTTIAANLATCINAGGATHCTVTSGFLAALLAFHDANGFGYEPRAYGNGAKLGFDQPWAASGNSVATYLSGGATETLTAAANNTLDNGPYMETNRFVPGRTPVAGDQLGPFYFGGQSAANTGLDTQYGIIAPRVLVADPTNPQGELQIATSDSGSAKNANPKLYIGQGVTFADLNGVNCGYGGLGVGVVCGQMKFVGTVNPQLYVSPLGSADGQSIFDTGATGTNSYHVFRYQGTNKVQYGQFGANLFGFYDIVNGAYGLKIATNTGTMTLGETGALTLVSGGGAQIGSPTGGDCGAGCLNAAALRLNNDANFALLDIAQSWTAPQRTNTETPAIATTTFTPVFSTGQNHRIAFPASTCTCTIANPAAIVAGQSGVFELVQGATSASLNPSWGSEYVYPGGTGAITLTTTLGGVDYIPYYVDSTGTYIVLGGIISKPVH
jgi:hypothetical protein